MRVGLVVLAMLVAALCLWPQAEPTPPVGATESSSTARAPNPSSGGHVPVPATHAGREHTSQGKRTPVAAPPRLFLIRGRLTRDGVGVPGRRVICYRGWAQQQNATVTTRDGVFEFEVDPAEYELLVPHASGTPHEQHVYQRFPISAFSRIAAARAPVKVTDADCIVHLKLPSHAIVVRVRDAEGLAPVAGATVIWRPPVPAMEELHVTADAAGYVRIADVVAGDHEVAATARAFASAEKSVTVAKQGPDGVVELRLKPSCAVDLVLVDEKGQPVAVSAAQRLMLIRKPTGWPVYADNPKRRRGRERPLSTPFNNLEAGRYGVYLDQDVVESNGDERTVRFAPCVQKNHPVLDLELGRLQRVEVAVEQRSYATLRAADHLGELLTGSLRVTHVGTDGVERVVLPAPWQTGDRHGGAHFEGYLPRGRYSLTFVGNGKTWKEELVVDQHVTDQTLMPTW